MSADLVDQLYASPYVTLTAGVVLTSLAVFADELPALHGREAWGAACLLLLGACLLYEDNPAIAFMMAGFVGALSRARVRRTQGSPISK